MIREEEKSVGTCECFICLVLYRNSGVSAVALARPREVSVMMQPYDIINSQ